MDEVRELVGRAREGCEESRAGTADGQREYISGGWAARSNVSGGWADRSNSPVENRQSEQYNAER